MGAALAKVGANILPVEQNTEPSSRKGPFI